MCVGNRQTIRFAQHNRRNQAVMRVAGIALPFRILFLPANHIDKVIASRGDDLRNRSPARTFQPCLAGRYGGAMDVVAKFLRAEIHHRDESTLFGE